MMHPVHPEQCYEKTGCLRSPGRLMNFFGEVKSSWVACMLGSSALQNGFHETHTPLLSLEVGHFQLSTEGESQHSAWGLCSKAFEVRPCASCTWRQAENSIRGLPAIRKHGHLLQPRSWAHASWDGMVLPPWNQIKNQKQTKNKACELPQHFILSDETS